MCGLLQAEAFDQTAEEMKPAARLLLFVGLAACSNLRLDSNLKDSSLFKQLNFGGVKDSSLFGLDSKLRDSSLSKLVVGLAP